MGDPSSSDDDNNNNGKNGGSRSSNAPSEPTNTTTIETTGVFLKVGGDHRLRRRNNKPPAASQQQAPPNNPPRYNPAIYTYICRGAFHATSLDSHEGGVCNGFKSQLEVLYNEQQESLTRAEALKRFTSMNAEFELDPTAGGHDHGGDDDMYGGGLHEQTQAVMISPALIFKDQDLMDQQEPIEDKNQRKAPVVVNPLLNQHNILPEEELIHQQEWHCYGSTEVEYLVLEDIQTGERKITAVAPHNTGISRRTIESDDAIRSITRIGLGWLDIIHDNHHVVTAQPSTTSSTTDATNSSADDDPESLTTQSFTPDEIWTTVRDTVQRTYQFSTTVAEHMQWNSLWLYENVRDDFPRRTYQAGEKIVAQLPHTLQQTATSMRQIVGMITGMTDDDDDDDDNDGYNGRKSG